MSDIATILHPRRPSSPGQPESCRPLFGPTASCTASTPRWEHRARNHRDRAEGPPVPRSHLPDRFAPVAPKARTLQHRGTPRETPREDWRCRPPAAVERRLHRPHIESLLGSRSRWDRTSRRRPNRQEGAQGRSVPCRCPPRCRQARRQAPVVPERIPPVPEPPTPRGTAAAGPAQGPAQPAHLQVASRVAWHSTADPARGGEGRFDRPSCLPWRHIAGRAG